ncbi:MAG: aspartate/glutamate racemase family protein [Candidatus Methanofastidiosia archaeon]|jgi:aspartate racemase
MKVIGLIGGMSWESSLEYYKIINEMVKERLGGLHSAVCVLYSVDFEQVEALQHAGNWEALTGIMVDAAHNVEKAGADFVLICTNTMHKMADQVQASISVPLVHIADAAGEKITELHFNTVGLLGTKFTMEEDFYKGRLHKKFGVQTLIPSKKQRDIVHTIIYTELCCGEIKDESRNTMKKIIADLASQGAEGIILGCTEIPLLISQKDSPVPIFDTMYIHAEAAVNFALDDNHTFKN